MLHLSASGKVLIIIRIKSKLRRWWLPVLVGPSHPPSRLRYLCSTHWAFSASLQSTMCGSVFFFYSLVLGRSRLKKFMLLIISSSPVLFSVHNATTWLDRAIHWGAWLFFRMLFDVCPVSLVRLASWSAWACRLLLPWPLPLHVHSLHRLYRNLLRLGDYGEWTILFPPL